jgi:orotate phosphoribosyltransferase-like protein
MRQLSKKDAGLKTSAAAGSLGMWMDVPDFFIAVQKSDRSTNAVKGIKVEWSSVATRKLWQM